MHGRTPLAQHSVVIAILCGSRQLYMKSHRNASSCRRRQCDDRALRVSRITALSDLYFSAILRQSKCHEAQVKHSAPFV